MRAASRSVAEALRPVLAHEATGQLLRFAIAGAGVTALSTALYLLLALSFAWPPLAATGASHAAGVVVGYLVHRSWSFRTEAATLAGFLRFAFASLLALALNALWVWLATGVAHLPAWTPVPAMTVATPLASFALNRWWVFAR